MGSFLRSRLGLPEVELRASETVDLSSARLHRFGGGIKVLLNGTRQDLLHWNQQHLGCAASYDPVSSPRLSSGAEGIRVVTAKTKKEVDPAWWG